MTRQIDQAQRERPGLWTGIQGWDSVLSGEGQSTGFVGLLDRTRSSRVRPLGSGYPDSMSPSPGYFCCMSYALILRPKAQRHGLHFRHPLDPLSEATCSISSVRPSSIVFLSLQTS
ncbi:hypothetical protein VTN77DRAFT_4750 [Rasamsonia byssochlamydoides]|uniref:uncharacterized protein n=1 Tax=Rasamsonia byssochlamydoides TaxID=89139 RepID=UPI003743F8CD